MNSLQSLFSSSRQADFSTRQTLTLIGLAGLFTLLVAILPWLNWLNYPFRLLLTIVHELGHGLAALLTGGEFIRFVVHPNGAGLATTAGGWRFVVIPAGYLGVALFGALLILLGRSYRWGRLALGVIGAGMIFLSLRYGVPSIFSAYVLSGILTTLSGFIFGGLFLGVSFKAPPGGIIFLLHLIAIQAVLTAFSDLFGLIGLSAHFFSTPENDAQAMAQLTHIPAIVWAVLWAIVAVALIGGAIWQTWLKPVKTKPSPELPGYQY
ncbi:MAG: M50 family metallopeptidase [Anaerolineae bacterium]|nr:M50 family metallopeptidase [Anaerolineae bacterium]